MTREFKELNRFLIRQKLRNQQCISTASSDLTKFKRNAGVYSNNDDPTINHWHINGCLHTHTITVAITISTSIVIPMLLSQCIFAQEPEFLTYESKEFGFSIQYPSDWKKEEENMSKSSNVNIAVSFVKQNGSQGGNNSQIVSIVA